MINMFKKLFKLILDSKNTEINQKNYIYLCQFHGEFKRSDKIDHCTKCKVGNYFMQVQFLNYNQDHQFQQYRILDIDKNLLFKCQYDFNHGKALRLEALEYNIKIWDNKISYKEAHATLKEMYQAAKIAWEAFNKDNDLWNSSLFQV